MVTLVTLCAVCARCRQNNTAHLNASSPAATGRAPGLNKCNLFAGAISLTFRLSPKSGCWEIGFRQISSNMFILYKKWRPISNIAYEIRYSTILFILEFQQNIYKKSRTPTTCRPAMFSWRSKVKHIVKYFPLHPGLGSSLYNTLDVMNWKCCESLICEQKLGIRNFVTMRLCFY